MENGDWWCPMCQEALSPQRVTAAERCDTCGTPVCTTGCGHEAEIAKLQKQVQVQADEITYLSGELDTERHRGEELQEKLADLMNAIHGAMDPSPDEEHCTCVPLLRAEIARLQKELAKAQARLAVIAAGILPDGDHVPLPVQVYAQERP